MLVTIQRIRDILAAKYYLFFVYSGHIKFKRSSCIGQFLFLQLKMPCILKQRGSSNQNNVHEFNLLCCTLKEILPISSQPFQLKFATNYFFYFLTKLSFSINIMHFLLLGLPFLSFSVVVFFSIPLAIFLILPPCLAE